MKKIGNILIIFSIVAFFALLYPIMRIYLFPPPVTLQEQPSEDFRIIIPSIHAAAPVIEEVDPWNETIYHEALKHGVAQAKGFALPGEPGNTFLFAHSSGPPWEQLYYNTVFLRLGELHSGDEIILERKTKRYRYSVTTKKEVRPDEISYLKGTDHQQLILMTCTPIGTSLRRLLVFATPIPK